MNQVDLKALESLAQRLQALINPELTPWLRHYGELSSAIQAITDERNGVLQGIRDKLKALALGVEVWLDEDGQWLGRRRFIESGDQPGSRLYEATELGYAQFADGWAFAVRNAR